MPDPAKTTEAGRRALRQAFADLIDSLDPPKRGPDRTATMSDLTIPAQFDNAPAISYGDPDYVIRRGKLFEVGDYPDKQFAFDQSDLIAAVAAFQPVPVDLEHVPTVLEGKLGQVRNIYASDDGRTLMGDVELPRWLDTLLEDGQRKVSATWDRATKQLRGLALVRNPRVSDAALMAAFAGTRHDTPSGQASLQEGHDWTVQRGAVCNRVAMASRHEISAIQAAHDVYAAHGAQCEPHARAAMSAPTTPKRSTRMNLREWLTGQAKDQGFELDDAEMDAAFSNPEKLTALQTEIADLKAQREKDQAAFARVAEERRQAEAVTFAQTHVAAHRVPPAAAEALSALTARISAADSTATFAEGETTTTALLTAFIESLPDLSVFSAPQLPNDAVAHLFNQATTPGNGQPAAPDDKRIAELLKLTPLGVDALANGHKS